LFHVSCARTCQAADPGGEQQARGGVGRVSQLVQQSALEEHLELSQPAAGKDTADIQSAGSGRQISQRCSKSKPIMAVYCLNKSIRPLSGHAWCNQKRENNEPGRWKRRRD
jgi:hypothetical protein